MCLAMMGLRCLMMDGWSLVYGVDFGGEDETNSDGWAANELQTPSSITCTSCTFCTLCAGYLHDGAGHIFEQVAL